MSCLESLTKSIDKEVTYLLKNISSKYNIDEKEILEMWTSKNTVAPQVSNTSNTPEENALMKLSKSELIEMCKGKALKVTGTKNDLVNRISECDKKKSTFRLDNVIKVMKKKKFQFPANFRFIVLLFASL